MNDAATLSVAVMSGKGGVGKSNIALNLGYALAQAGHPLLLMDCDLGLANLDVLLGIAPEGNLQQVIMDERAAADIIYPISEKGRGYFDILPAASGVPELAEMNGDMRDLLLRRLEPELQKYSVVLLDLGAGINGTVRSFAAMAAVRLLIMTPEPTSLTDSYSLIKVLNAQLGIRDFLVVVNDVESKEEETALFERLSLACERFLGFTPVLLGTVRHDPAMPRAVCRQQPLLKVEPEAPAAKDILRLAGELLKIRGVMAGRLKGNPVLKNLARVDN